MFANTLNGCYLAKRQTGLAVYEKNRPKIPHYETITLSEGFFCHLSRQIISSTKIYNLENKSKQ